MLGQKSNPRDAGINKRYIPIQTLRDDTIHYFARLLFKQRYETSLRSDCLTYAGIGVREIPSDRDLIIKRRYWHLQVPQGWTVQISLDITDAARRGHVLIYHDRCAK